MEVKQEGIVFGLIWFVLFSESALIQKKGRFCVFFFSFYGMKVLEEVQHDIVALCFGFPLYFLQKNRRLFLFLCKRLIFPSTPLLFLLKEHRKVFVLAYSD